MANTQELEMLKKTKLQRAGFKFVSFFKSIPEKLKKLGLSIWAFLKKAFWGFVNFFKDLGLTFWHGDWKTKVSYVIMGFGSIMRGQWLRGLLFLLFEVVFIVYMVAFGGMYFSQLYILGTNATYTTDDGVVITGDNSFNILLFGTLTLFFIAAFIYTWHLNIKQNKINE